MSLEISVLAPDPSPEWDEYVSAHPAGTFFHKSGWQYIITQAFGHNCYYLQARSEGRLQGVLPLAHVRSLLFGNNLVSTPFCVYGGILASSEAAGKALRDAACDLARELQVDSLELRNIASGDSGWPEKSLYVTFRKRMPDSADNVLPFIPNKQRAVVRKGIKAGLVSEEGWHGKRMYDLYAESLRNLGTPVFGARYFDMLREVFGNDCRSLLIQSDGRDIAGVLSFYFRDQVLPYYAGSGSETRAMYAHAFMYAELMKNSVEQGLQWFDFGRSKEGTGSYSFKKNWGFEPEPLHYEYFLVKSDRVPEVNPMNPKYQLFIKAWKSLPLVVANRLGPMLAKSLG